LYLSAGKLFCIVWLAGLQALQAEGSWREAERHFCDAKEWKAAVAMYRQQGSWEDALRVAKVFGGLAAAKQVRFEIPCC
jgi:intraflagellar transport protein 172